MKQTKQQQEFIDKVRQNAHSIGELLYEKNYAYGDSINKAPKIMEILYPNGIPENGITDSLLVVRMLDKICRIASGNKSAFGENPYKDIAGYAVLGMTQYEMNQIQKEKTNDTEQENL